MSTRDNNYFSLASRRPLGDVDAGDLQPGAGYQDTLKITDCSAGRVLAGHVQGGSEDCVDVNNKCQGIIIEATLWEPRGKYLATIKGGSRDIVLRGKVRGHGSVVDVDLGNISDQSDNVTGPVHIDLEHEAGEPITVRCLNSVRPKFLNADRQRYEVTFRIPGFWRSLFAKAYALLKRLGLPI